MKSYRRVHELGRGGMAQVTLMLEGAGAGGPGEGRLVVEKRALRGPLHRDYEKLLLRESRIGLSLRHPNIITTLGTSEHAGEVGLLLEYVEGKTLAELLRLEEFDSFFSLEDGLAILAEVLSGLAYLHEARSITGEPLQFVHCDLCPANILLGRAGEVKLIDFGASHSAKEEPPLSATHPVGRLSYLAPERLQAGTPSAASDIFSVGAMLYQLLTKVRLWQGVPEGEIRRALAAGEIAVDLYEAAPHAPPALLAICARALAAQPEARFADAAELLAELDDYLAVTAEVLPSRRELGKKLELLFGEEFERRRELLAEVATAPASCEARAEEMEERGGSSLLYQSSFSAAVLGALVGGAVVFVTALLY